MELLTARTMLTEKDNNDSASLDRKLNVALTRARQQLFVIGIPQVLATDTNYRAMMAELSKEHLS